MTYGAENDYPEVIERLILGSITSKACADIYGKFLVGNGFNENFETGVNKFGQPVFLNGLLRDVVNDVKYFGGFYVHCTKNVQNQVVSVKHIPFKYCRFSKEDETGNVQKVGVSSCWGERDFKSEKVQWYSVFSYNQKTFESRVTADGGTIESYAGEIFFCFLDNRYLYPLSPFDPVYLDCSSEYEYSNFRNNELRNGMNSKVIIRVGKPDSDEDEEKMQAAFKDLQGADGSKMIVLTTDIDPVTGGIPDNDGFKVDVLPTNINDKIFEAWDKSLSNNIRKAAKGMPAVLIDYDESKLGTTSGESLLQAIAYYNNMTKDDRLTISEALSTVFGRQLNIIDLNYTTNGTTNIPTAATN